MKLIIFLALVPFVYGECPPPPQEPVICAENEMFCPGTVWDGCPMPDWCMWNGGDCPAHCPIDCGEQEWPCFGGYDADECPLPDVCSVGGCCPPTPVNCGENETFCPGSQDAGGCQMPDYCIPNDHCPAHCPMDPMQCGEQEHLCFGGYDADWCVLPEVCSVGGCCPPEPMNCGDEEMFCPGSHDYNTGCEMPGFCMPIGNCAASFCPLDCGPQEHECYMGYDDEQCPLPPVCSDGGICPEPAM